METVALLSNRQIKIMTNKGEEKAPEDSDGETNRYESGFSEPLASIALASIVIGFILSFWLIFFADKPVLSILPLVFGVGWPLILTKEGREIIRGRENPHNRHQHQTKDGAKQICQDCGYLNPFVNNYCTDCGAELKSW